MAHERLHPGAAERRSDLMGTINRRQVLQLLGAAPMAAGFVWTETEVLEAQQKTQQARRGPVYKPSFFTAHEYATVVLLSELIIPKDERSAGATEAGVPQFMDFMMLDQPARQVPMRGGLAWLDQESNSRFKTNFRASTEAQRTAILDDISGLEAPSPDLSHGIAFFRSFRDLVATDRKSTRLNSSHLVITYADMCLKM